MPSKAKLDLCHYARSCIATWLPSSNTSSTTVGLLHVFLVEWLSMVMFGGIYISGLNSLGLAAGQLRVAAGATK